MERTMRRPPGGRAEPRGLRIAVCGPGQAEVVHRLTRAAFSGQSALDPPSGAGRETLDEVRADLAAHCGAIAWLGGRAVGCLRFERAAEHMHVRRVAVEPELQGGGIGGALMAWAEADARRHGLPEVTVGVRLALARNLAWYRRLGYEVVGEHAHPGHDRPTWASLRKRVPAGP
ncbi:MAG TPA: GNAT family N-acetyltransferase, partial [Candidatus Eisenbacteria bacterium]|nr:GNAT family N-acetyltransferase [Candidatus Eisenbacteria bacterium]